MSRTIKAKAPLPPVADSERDSDGDAPSTSRSRPVTSRPPKLRAASPTVKKTKAAPRKPRVTRKAQKAGRDGKKPEERKEYARTYTVPLRVKSYWEACFMCSKDEAAQKAEPLVQCGHKGCKQSMHASCAANYICGEYSPSQAQLLFRASAPVCPGHFCWHCYEERYKNAARFGDFVDCQECLRTFHVDCIPAGCRISGLKQCTSSDRKLRKTFVCHLHDGNGAKGLKNARLKYCVDCEECFNEDASMAADDDMAKVECKTCSNVFHRRCSFKEVKGPGSEDYKHDRCSSCLIGSTIVHEQQVLAYSSKAGYGYPPGYYPAEAVALDAVPPRIQNSLGANFDKVGWVPVRWHWPGTVKPFYSMVRRTHVQRVTAFCSSKNVPDDNFIEILENLSWEAPTVLIDNFAMKKEVEMIPRNEYSKEMASRRLTKEPTNECVCTPHPVTRIKCATRDCQNRDVYFECPKSCDEEDGVRCANRALQRSNDKEGREGRWKKYAVREAEGKGCGLFATQAIEPLEFIIEYIGEVIDEKEWAAREDRMRTLRAHDEWTYGLELKRNRLVDSRWKGNESRYANHSCDPNAKVHVVSVPVRTKGKDTQYEQRLMMTALRKIRPDEEITFNYGLEKSAGLRVDVCRCGAANCSGKIGKKVRKEESDDEEEETDQSESEDESEDDEDKENQGKRKSARGGQKKRNAEEEAARKRARSGSVASRSRLGKMKKDAKEESSASKRARRTSSVAPSSGPAAKKRRDEQQGKASRRSCSAPSASAAAEMKKRQEEQERQERQERQATARAARASSRAASRARSVAPVKEEEQEQEQKAAANSRSRSRVRSVAPPAPSASTSAAPRGRKLNQAKEEERAPNQGRPRASTVAPFTLAAMMTNGNQQRKKAAASRGGRGASVASSVVSAAAAARRVKKEEPEEDEETHVARHRARSSSADSAAAAAAAAAAAQQLVEVKEEPVDPEEEEEEEDEEEDWAAWAAMNRRRTLWTAW